MGAGLKTKLRLMLSCGRVRGWSGAVLGLILASTNLIKHLEFSIFSDIDKASIQDGFEFIPETWAFQAEPDSSILHLRRPNSSGRRLHHLECKRSGKDPVFTRQVSGKLPSRPRLYHVPDDCRESPGSGGHRGRKVRNWLAAEVDFWKVWSWEVF